MMLLYLTTKFKRRHRILTWIVDSTTELCDAIHQDYLDPPVEQLRERARALREPGRSAVQTSAGQTQLQSQS